MTRRDQQLILDAVQAVPRDDLPQLRAMAEADRVYFFVDTIAGDALYDTQNGSLAMGFVGGWIAAMKSCVAAELAAERQR